MRSRSAIGFIVGFLTCLVLAVVARELRKPPQPKFPSDWHRVCMMQQFSLLESKADVVMLGDSLTDAGRWRELLPDFVVVNRGISADTVSGLRPRLDDALKCEPKVACLMIGINDLAAGAEPESVAKEIDAIVDSIQSRGVTVVLHGILQTNSELRTNPGLNDRVKLCNSLLSRIDCYYLDLNPVLSDDLGLSRRFTLDGVHLNGEGYVLWADSLSELLQRKSILCVGQ